MKKKKEQKLQQDLNAIAEDGIQADMHHLKKDMVSQFADCYEAYRELCVNSADAKATHCTISLSEDKDTTIISVVDDGHGMDKQALLDYFKLYRSNKVDPDTAIGRFGIGKLSIAAIPDQQSMTITTSTGEECWIAKVGRLLEPDPVTLYKVEEDIEQGTRFDIVFKKNESLETVRKRIIGILETYVKYLNLEVKVLDPIPDEETGYIGYEVIHGRWLSRSDYAMYFPSEKIGKNTYEITMELGGQAHEVYQNKVFITNKYNLWSHGQKKGIYIPHIKIKVDSRDFVIPFGRHCLSNEEVLNSLSKHIRENLLPRYYHKLWRLYSERRNGRLSPRLSQFMEVTLALMTSIPDLDRDWCKVPIFKVFPDKEYSLNQLENEVLEAGNKLYLSEENSTGIDYSLFDAPVVLHDQTAKGIQFLKSYFSKELVNLSNSDLIIKAPAGNAPNLTENEMRFAQHLGFLKEIANMHLGKADAQRLTRLYDEKPDRNGDIEDGLKNFKKAQSILESINWRVAYLVEKDGRTPVKRVMFLFKDDEVTLNLYHSHIKELVQLGSKAPHLSGHWAVALCLTEDQKIFSHLDTKTTENLLSMDAISKVDNMIESNVNDGIGSDPTKRNDDESQFGFSSN